MGKIDRRRIQAAFWAPQDKLEEKTGDDAGAVEAAGEETGETNAFRPGLKFYMSFCVFIALSLLVAIDMTAVGVALLPISQHLQSTTTQSEWIGNGYMITACAFQLFYSSLSDIYGRLPLVMVSFSLFFLGGLICGVSHNIQAMLAGRVIQGIGAAGTLVLPEVFIADVVPLRQRGVYYGILGVAWAVGAGIGPILGGGFAEKVTWRWIFYINLPIAGISLILTPFVLKLKLQKTTKKEKLASVDFVGNLIFLAASTLVVLGLSFGGVTYPWSSAGTLAPLIIGLVLFVVVGVYEHYIPEKPMVNMRMFASKDAVLAYIQNILQSIALSGILYYLPMYYQGVLLYNPLFTGLALLPEAVLVTPSALLVGVWIQRTMHYHSTTWIAFIVSVMGMGLFYLLDENTTVGQWIGISIPGSLGIGALYSSLSTAVLAPLSPELWTDSAAFMSFSRSLGEALGVAIGGAVFASQMRDRVAKIGALDVDATKVLELVAYIEELPQGDIRSALMDALVESLRTLYIVFTVILGIGLILCLFIKEYTLDVESTPLQGIEE